MGNNHTPTPWKLMANGHQIYAEVNVGPTEQWGKTDSFIAECKTNHTPEIIEKANAAFIVKAVNNHEKLKQRLQLIINNFNSEILNQEDINKAQSFLNSIKGGE